jgi:hypothetical protein
MPNRLWDAQGIECVPEGMYDLNGIIIFALGGGEKLTSRFYTTSRGKQQMEFNNLLQVNAGAC